MSFLDALGYFAIGCAGGLYAACWMECAKAWRKEPRCGFPWKIAMFGPIVAVFVVFAWAAERMEDWVTS